MAKRRKTNVKTILSFLEERFLLGPNDRRRLSALIDIYRQDRPSLATIVKSIDGVFNEAQLRAVGRFLVDVAAASDGISPEEIGAMERVFKLLNLSTSLVFDFVRDSYAAPSEATVRTQEATVQSGEPIPHEPEMFDIERIRRLRAESDEVSKMLVAAMEEALVKDEVDTNIAIVKPVVPIKVSSNETPTIKTTPAPSADVVDLAGNKLSLLRSPLRAIIRELVSKDAWARNDVEALARKKRNDVRGGN